MDKKNSTPLQTTKNHTLIKMDCPQTISFKPLKYKKPNRSTNVESKVPTAVESPLMDRSYSLSDALILDIVGGSRNDTQNSERLIYESKTCSLPHHKLRRPQLYHEERKSVTVSGLDGRYLQEAPVATTAIVPKSPENQFPSLRHHPSDIQHVRNIIKSVRVEFNQIMPLEVWSYDSQNEDHNEIRKITRCTSVSGSRGFSSSSVFGFKNKQRRVPASGTARFINTNLVENQLYDYPMFESLELHEKIVVTKREIEDLNVIIRKDPLDQVSIVRRRERKKELSGLLERRRSGGDDY